MSMWKVVCLCQYVIEAIYSLTLPTNSFAGESIMAYLIAVLTDLLHTQRDPLALCLMLQSYDKFEPANLLCCQQLAQFHRYYSLWIPEQAQEVLVSCTHCSSPVFLLDAIAGCAAVWFRCCTVQSESLTFPLPLLKRRAPFPLSSVSVVAP